VLETRVVGEVIHGAGPETQLLGGGTPEILSEGPSPFVEHINQQDICCTAYTQIGFITTREPGSITFQRSQAAPEKDFSPSPDYEASFGALGPLTARGTVLSGTPWLALRPLASPPGSLLPDRLSLLSAAGSKTDSLGSV
jgi:hypothetical protein